MITNSYTQDAYQTDKISYRPPTVAGAFYPADSLNLSKMLDTLFVIEKPVDLSKRNIIGMVVPHAGYVYSGKVAGKAYRELQGRHYDAIIIVSPSHQKSFNFSSVFNGDAYVSPLGIVNVDKELAKEISGYSDKVKYSIDGHDWRSGTPEHAIEVQLPFIQRVLPNTPIVPIVMGNQDMNSTDVLMRAIVTSVKKLKRNVLLIASSDLSHYHPADSARIIDEPLVRAFGRLDYFALQTQLRMGSTEACGGGPIVVVMMAAEQLGGVLSVTLKYLHSGKTDAGRNSQDRVVGYFSGVICDGRPEEATRLPFINDDDRHLLLNSVKNEVEKVVLSKNDTDYAVQYIPTQYAMTLPAFVTITKNKELRACIGHTYSTKQLWFEICESARLAATSDDRFGPVKASELQSLEYEITVLSRLRRILDLSQIDVGDDGLLIRYGSNQGLLLPQVAAERHWNLTTYLENLCSKAGLPKDTYKKEDAQIYYFKAVIVKSENK